MRTKDVLFFIGGAAIGALVGLLLAPESGEKTRRRIRRFVEDEKDRLVGAYEDAKEKIEESLEKAGKQLKKG